MSASQTVPYISLRDTVVATTEGYAIRFIAGEVTEVPNYKNVIHAVQAAGCMPAEEISARVVKTTTKTIEGANEETQAARADQLLLAIATLIERDNPVDFNRAGAPQVKSLEQITGFEKISNTERDAAWKAYKASKE